MSWQISTKNKLEIDQIEPLIKYMSRDSNGSTIPCQLIILTETMRANKRPSRYNDCNSSVLFLENK